MTFSTYVGNSQNTADLLEVLNPLGKWALKIEKADFEVCYEKLHFEKTLNCSVLEKGSVVFNTAAKVFFTMTCLLRFYLIVVRRSQPQQEILTSQLQIIIVTVLGFAVNGFMFALTLDDQLAFSRSCFAPYEEKIPMGLYGKIYFLIVFLTDILVLVLYIIIVIKVTKIPTVTFQTFNQTGTINERNPIWTTVVVPLVQLIVTLITPTVVTTFFSSSGKYTNMQMVRFRINFKAGPNIFRQSLARFLAFEV